MAYTPIYTGGDLGSMAIDFVGAFLNALTGQSGTLAQLIVVVVIVGVVATLVAAVFGLINVFGGKKQ